MKSDSIRRLMKPFWLVWLALPAILLLLVQNVPILEWQGLVKAIRPSQLALLIAFNALVVFCFSTRWGLILQALNRPVSYLALLRYRLAAFSISYFTPGPQFGGEPLQVYGLEKYHHLPRPTALASVAADKLFDLLANFTFLAVGIALILNNGLFKGAAPGLAAVWGTSLFSLPMAYLLVATSGRRPLGTLIILLPARLRQKPLFIRLEAVIREAENQIVGLVRRDTSAVFSILGASLWIWLLSFAEYWLAARVLGASLTFHQTVVALTAARLAFLLPLPGAVGALEAGQVLAMQALGFSPALGIAIAIWIRIRDLTLAVLGFMLGAMLLREKSTAIYSADTGD